MTSKYEERVREALEMGFHPAQVDGFIHMLWNDYRIDDEEEDYLYELTGEYDLPWSPHEMEGLWHWEENPLMDYKEKLLPGEINNGMTEKMKREVHFRAEDLYNWNVVACFEYAKRYGWDALYNEMDDCNIWALIPEIEAEYGYGDVWEEIEEDYFKIFS